jgi:hypothetical protein
MRRLEATVWRDEFPAANRPGVLMKTGMPQVRHICRVVP